MTTEETFSEVSEVIPSIRKRKVILEESIKKTHANEKPGMITSQQGKTWGRARDVGFLYQLTAFAIMAFCPLMVIYFWLSCTHYGCSLSAPIVEQIEVYKLADDMYKRNFVDHMKAYVLKYFPKPTVEGFQLYFGWVLFQGLLYRVLPGKIAYGQTTPAGHKLPYIVNGTLAWVLCHTLFILGSLYFDLFPATIIYDNWGGLLVAANVYGYVLSLFVYIKACIAPSHADDRKFSGSFVYDLFWGVEFNPRFGKYFDFKLFHNGRPGILAWTMINFSFACAQYAALGKVTNSMILLNWFHFLYVIDFFLNEDWYLRTIDIAHDHFGFYLGWGDSVWLPFMYTLQSHYLVRNPVELSPAYFGAVVFIGHFGYYIFRSTNAQKDIVRKTNGKCYIWGKPAKFIKTEYATSDGKVHNSLLLTSGFWGLSRHFNYLGDLFISLSMCLTCRFDHLLPYFYVIYMTILLLTRIHRDQGRCQEKYGKYWDEYCKAVPYKLIPYVF